MPHCLNCGKPITEHVEVTPSDGALGDSPVYVCPTSTYDEVDDVVGDPPDADR